MLKKTWTRLSEASANESRLVPMCESFFFQAEDGIRDKLVTGVQTCALPIFTCILLVATGRSPNVAGLNLEAASIKYDKRGIQVNKGLVTSNSRVFAIGDVVGGPQFTHIANYHAGIVLRRALFRLPAKVDSDIVPWVTFTDPELAHVGLTEDAARKRNARLRVFRWPYHENDRAQTERDAEGFIKVVADAKGKIL